MSLYLLLPWFIKSPTLGHSDHEPLLSLHSCHQELLEEIAHSVYWTAPRIWFPASPGLSSLLSILSFVISGFFQIFFSPVSPLFNLRLPFSKKMTLSPSLTKGHQARSPFFFLLLLSISTFNVQFPNGIPRIPMFFSTSPLFPKQSSLTPPHPSLSSLY